MYETAFELPGEAYETGDSEMFGESELGYESYEGESDALEAELAQELLEITSEEELDRFLGKLASSVVKGASRFVKSPVGKALGGVLKTVAKRALPVVGGALGSMVLPGAGTAIGAKLGSMAGGLLEAEEAEAMGEVEAEYEAALRYVRFARGAYGNAARAPRNLPPRAVVRAASTSSARRYAPSLLRSDRRTAPWRTRRRSGGRPRPAWSYYEPVPWQAADPYAGSWDDGGDADQWGDDGQYGEYGEADEAGGGRAAAGRAAGMRGPAGPSGAPATSGRWVRRGNRIVIHGA